MVELTSLRARFRGELLTAADGALFDTARAAFNAAFDRRPAVIARATDAADVISAVTFAREFHTPLAVRGGGHSVAGYSTIEGGLLLDLGPMKGVRVDVAARRVHAQAGVTWGELDRETQAFGLSTPTGINSTTGMAGLTLGGGFGWQSRKRGLTIDNLLGVDVVLASGEFVQASPTQNADLFWAVRGGGGNFGVVTSFEYRLHKLGPEVLAGLIVYPIEQARQVFEGYRAFTASAPDEMTAWLVMRKAPPLPFLPASVHGTEVVVLAFCWIGETSQGNELAAHLRRFGTAAGEHVGAMPFAAWQTAFDPLLERGARNYWKSHDFKTLNVDVERILCEAIGRLPTAECEAFIGHLGGAVNRVPTDATAYPHRDVEYVINVHTRWRDSSDDARCIDWARQLFDALAPHATGGVYVNFMPEDEAQRVAAGAYGPNYARLGALKAKYDPANLFCLNQNIRPQA